MPDTLSLGLQVVWQNDEVTELSTEQVHGLVIPFVCCDCLQLSWLLGSHLSQSREEWAALELLLKQVHKIEQMNHDLNCTALSRSP